MTGGMTAPTVEAELQLAGVKVMENGRARISREGGVFWIGGLADYESRALAAVLHCAGPLRCGPCPTGEPVIVM